MIVYGICVIVISLYLILGADWDEWGMKSFGIFFLFIGTIIIGAEINSIKSNLKKDVNKVMIDNRIEFIQDTLITTKKGDTIKYNKNIEFFNKENKKY